MGTSQHLDTGTAGGGAALGSALDREARPSVKRVATYQRIANESRGTGGQSLSDFLGFFSIGLGLAQVAMPGVMSRVVGIDHEDGRNRNMMRLMGAREISHGLAILTQKQPEKAVWSRVAGDVLDLALLGKALTNRDNARARTLFATANVLAVTALDVLAATSLTKQPDEAVEARTAGGVIRTTRSVTIRKPVPEVYGFWRNFENLPQFMRHLESVTVTGARTSHWVAKAPAGQRVEWDAETTEDVENERISWRSLEGAPVYNAGTVTFRRAPGDRGTEVRVELAYDPPFGKLGSKVAMLWREEPGQQVQDDLRHFKQVLEVGEIVLSDATKQRGMHPATPNERPVQL